MKTTAWCWVSIEWVSANAEFVMVVVTTFYTITTIAIWWATRGNTKATRQVLEAAHRPYISLRVRIESRAGNAYDLITSIQNAGTAPAQHIYLFVGVDVFAFIDDFFEGEYKNDGFQASESEIILFPGESHSFTKRLVKDEEYFAQGRKDYRAACYVTYSGGNSRKYTSAATFTCDDSRCCTISSGQMT